MLKRSLQSVDGTYGMHHSSEYLSKRYSAPNTREGGTCLTSAQKGTELRPDSAWKRSQKNCMKLTSAECTVDKSWCWAEAKPETCRIL
jgi:hypothetical protein